MKRDPIGKFLLIACVLSMLMAIGSVYKDHALCATATVHAASASTVAHTRSGDQAETPIRSG